MRLQELNSLPAAAALDSLILCCGSRRWAERMTGLRPFADSVTLRSAAERTWWDLARGDWLEAFSHHPRIGDVESLRKKFASTAAWAGDEQKGAMHADERTLDALARGNSEYEARFGHVFLICATGKSASEMLTALRHRIGNEPTAELRIAAEEQAKIAALRLGKLIEEN